MSTAQGCTAAIAARTFACVEPAGQDDATVRLGCSVPVVVVLGEPGQVEHTRDLCACSQQHRVAPPMAVLDLVELNEIGAHLERLVDADGDRQHRLRHGEDAGRLARGVGEDEAREVCSGLGGGGDVLLAGQTADLDERPRDELGELRGGSGAFMSDEPTRIASAPASSAAAPWALLQIPLSATTTRSCGAAATSSS